jgi:hypothetical protein
MLKGKIDPQNASSIFTSFWLRAASAVKFTSSDASPAKTEFTTTAKIKILNGFIFFPFIVSFVKSVWSIQIRRAITHRKRLFVRHAIVAKYV